MKRKAFLKNVATAVPALWLSSTRLFGRSLPMEPFIPDWESLQHYQTPDWFRNGKLGIWAHWGAQCQPEHGDWYARGMYEEGSDAYKFHLEKYGHPSKFGFKDVIHEWKAENWDPERLVSLYKKAGARYFVAMANHHDNFDNFNSRYQPWNSTKMGPKKDLIAGWAKAAKNNGLPFGVSIHATHAWTFYEPSQRADKTGSLAGVPYDGKLMKEAGKGAWWEGWDPQALYSQDHAVSQEENIGKIWDWNKGVTLPSKGYIEKFHRRTLQLIDDYGPDLIYFDDSKLPFWPIDPAGLEIAAYMYNHSMKKHGGQLQAVIAGKILEEAQRKALVWDVERGASNRIEPLPWQTDTCIGNWHYDRRIYDHDKYKSVKTVIHTLADVVSKNGNLLLNIPVRGDGTIDEKEEKVVAGITAWMGKYSEAIYDTRPWKILGEGPALEGAAEIKAQGFNEGKGKPFTGEDIRFTSKGDVLYAIALGAPVGGKLRIRALAAGSEYFPGPVGQVSLVGQSRPLVFHREAGGLMVEMPQELSEEFAYAIKITS